MSAASGPLGPGARGDPLVAVVMGSASDLGVMRAAVDVLDRFGVPREVRVLSAHRTPGEMLRFAETAVDRGLRVLVAGAGGAAHLPGMLAAGTALPVVGVPVALGRLADRDALLASVPMPRGGPGATVGIDGAANAGLLAVRILALADPTLARALGEHRDEIAGEARAQDAALGRA
jgi:5-(carboxyamino)imidazole ribonucleotide mutase